MWKKFCEQDTNEENKLRMKYERRFRYLLRWNITNEEGLFKKELFDKQHAISLTRLGKYLFGYMCATSNIPYKYIGDYLYAIEKEKPISKWRTKGETLFNYLVENVVEFKLDKEPRTDISEESIKENNSIIVFITKFEAIDGVWNKMLNENDEDNFTETLNDTEYNPINDMKQYFEGIIEGIDDNYLGKYYRKEHIKGGYIKKYKFKDGYTIFSIILLYFLNIIFCFYIGEQGWLFGRFTKKEDSVRIEDLKDIMFIINKDMYGAWGTGEENMNNKKNIHVENPQKDIEQQMRKYIIKNFFQPNKKCNISFNRLPYMKFLIINNKFSDFVDELIKDIAVWVYEKNHCETKYINCAKIIIDDMKNAFSKIVRNVYYGENYNYKNEENLIDPEFFWEYEDEEESEKIMLDILSIFSILTKEANNYGIKCKVPKTERTAMNKVDGGKGEQISKLRLFVDNMLTDKCSQFSNNEGYNNMINSIGGYEFERIFQPINFILDSMISIKMDEDKNLKNRIKNIRHYDNVKDKYKYIVNVTNYSTYPVFLGTYLKRMYLETEINVDKWVFYYIKNYRECFCDIYDSYEDEEDEQTSEFSYEVGHTLEYSCKYEKNIKKKVELLLKYGEMKEEQIAESSYKDEQTQEFSYKDEETEEEQALELDVLADEIKDIFHQNSYGMMNIENNYIEAMLSETFRYKDIDKNMRLSVRVKDAFIKYNSDKWLEKFKDVNTEWINECICLGEFFENIMKEMSEYLEQICEKEDIIAWSRNVVEECKKEDDINKLSEHLYGIWNSVYNYAIENKIAITKVRNEYFEKYFSSLKNERRQEEEELI